MRNFHQICRGLSVVQLVHSIARQPWLWNTERLRTTHHMSPHTQVDDIWLRFNDLEEYKRTGRAESVLDQHESINYPGLAALPAARPIIWDLMRLVEGERLGRVLVTRLAPGARIARHVDSGDHASYYDRYHVALQVLPGALFLAGTETVQMQTGDVWWFDNSVEHEVVNNSADDRLVMIVDIRTSGGSKPVNRGQIELALAGAAEGGEAC